jgi:hypothetical protein
MLNQRLTDTEFAIVQGALERLTDEMVEIGIEVTIETDFEEFARLRKMVGDGGCYPAVDPKFSRLDKDAFWLRVTDREDALVALYAERIYRTDDFVDLIRSERLWFDKGLRVVSPDYRLIENAFDTFGGVIGHGCGLWVAPAARRRGLSAFLPDYQRALAVRNFGIDWQTNLVFATLVEHTRKAYGYRTVERIIDGYFPVTQSSAEVYLGRMSRAEVLARLEVPQVAVTTVDPRARAAVAH